MITLVIVQDVSALRRAGGFDGDRRSSAEIITVFKAASTLITTSTQYNQTPMARGTHLPHGSSLLSMSYVRKTSATVVGLYFLTHDSSTWWVKGTKTKPLVISITRRLKNTGFFLSCVPADRVCNVGILKYVLLSRSVTTMVFFG
jgi:hypothetical protein